MIREESHFRTDVRNKESSAGGSQLLHHTLMVVASRKTHRIHASVCACVFVYACVCVCVCTCLFAHVDGRRVFGSFDSNSVVNWNRNTEKRNAQVHHELCLHEVDFGRPSTYEHSSPRYDGSEHSSAHRQLSLQTFEWIVASEAEACRVWTWAMIPFRSLQL